MPISVDWYTEDKNSIRYAVVGRWQWNELFDAIEEARILLDSVDYPVYIIIDFTKTADVPLMSVSQLGKIANATTMSHVNSKTYLMVGANKYIEMMMDIFKKLFPAAGKRYSFHSSLAELDTLWQS